MVHAWEHAARRKDHVCWNTEEEAMPIASPEVYRAMLDAAKARHFAYPAINVSSSETLNAALAGFAEARSDGIIQVTPSAAAFASGTGDADMALGAIALAEFA